MRELQERIINYLQPSYPDYTISATINRETLHCVVMMIRWEFGDSDFERKLMPSKILDSIVFELNLRGLVYSEINKRIGSVNHPQLGG